MRFDTLWLSEKLEEHEKYCKETYKDKPVLNENFTLEDLSNRGLIEDHIHLQERYAFLGEFHGIEARDTRHAEEEFERWFPNEKRSTLQKILKDGLGIIAKEFNYTANKYMIVSKSLGCRIPIDIRFDRRLYDRGVKKLIAAVPTVLGPQELHDKYREINILVEDSMFGSVNLVDPKHGYFCVWHSGGQVFAEFEDIVVS